MKLIFENGPILSNIQFLSGTSRQLTITFATSHAATIAHLATGWAYFTDTILEITGTGEWITINPPDDPNATATHYRDWTLAEDHYRSTH